MEKESIAYKRWDLVAGLEEKYLKQKSNIHWLEVGDKNNKTFQRALKTREAKTQFEKYIVLMVWWFHVVMR